MKKSLTLLIVLFISNAGFGFSSASIDLLFQGSPESNVWDYRIPNGDDEALTQLLTLSSSEVQSACLNGSPKSVIKNLDDLASQAQASVKQFERSEVNGKLHLRLDLLNARGQLQSVEMQLELCK